MRINHLNNNYNLILNLFLGLGLLLISCKKDLEINPNTNTDKNSDCENIPPFQAVGTGYTYIVIGQVFNFPVFNPNNSNEFLITKSDSVFIFNKALNTKSFSFKFSFWNKISWSRKNWLIMDGTDGKIYKIRPNGDSLTLLLNNTNNFYPIWNYTGTQFYVQNNSINKTIKYSNTGISLDTIQQLTTSSFSDCGANNKITWGVYSLNVYDMINNTSQNLYVIPTGKGSLLGCFWLNSNEIIWSYTYGIFKTNILTNSTTTLKNTCNSNSYSYPTFDISLNKIIWKKQIQTLVDSYTVKVENKIVITDVDCKNEEEIIIK